MATRKKAPAKKPAAKKKAPAKKKRAPAKKKPLSAAAGKTNAALTIQRDAPKPVGRPPKTISQAHLDMVRNLASQGCSKKNIAAMLGMGYSTYMEKQDTYPELSEAFDLGRQQGITAVAGALYQKALIGDVPAIKYFLNNQDPEEWIDKKVVEAGEEMAKSLASMRPEDRLELLNNQ